MLYTPKNSNGLKLVDSTGTEIPGAYEFDDQTNEVRFYVFGKRQNGSGHTAVRSGTSLFDGKGLELVKSSAIILGARMVARS